MTVEAATYFSQLDATLPLVGNVVPEGDDHLKLYKSVLQETLKGSSGGFDSFVLATENELNYFVGVTSNIQDQLTEIFNSQIPVGGIIAYDGAISAIASPFALCDGANGTPNLTDMFVYAANVEADVDNAGGSDDTVIATHNHSATHNHTGSTSADGAHTHDFLTGTNSGTPDTMNSAVSSPARTGTTGSSGSHSHSVTVTQENVTTVSNGVSGVGKNIPPYIYLAYVMRIS